MLGLPPQPGSARSSPFSAFVRGSRNRSPIAPRRLSADLFCAVSDLFDAAPPPVRRTRPDLILRPVPPISLPLTPNGLELLIAKFALCQNICDFTCPDADIDAREIKAATLRELEQLFQEKSAVTKWPAAVAKAFHSMVAKNIFRSIPPTDPVLLAGVEEPVLNDVSWPHLQLVYGLLVRFQQANTVDNPFGIRFLRRLADNLHVPDRNERDIVLCLIDREVVSHRESQEVICAKFADLLRLYGEGAIEPWPISPILKFYKHHWRDTWMRDRLRPDLRLLLSFTHIKSLLNPVMQLFETAIATDQALCAEILCAGIGRWPHSWPARQGVFLSLMVFLLQRLDPVRMTDLAVQIFALLARCARSDRRDVVLAALHIWTNPAFVTTAAILAPIVYPIVFPNIAATARKHWDPDVRREAAEALDTMRKIDQASFDRARSVQPRRVSHSEAFAVVHSSSTGAPRIKRERAWCLVARMAAARWPGMRSRIQAGLQGGVEQSPNDCY